MRTAAITDQNGEVLNYYTIIHAGREHGYLPFEQGY